MKKISNELLECKAFNHAWEPSAPNPKRAQTTLTDALFLDCVRCGSEKEQGIGAGGYLNSTTYRLSDRYKALKEKFPDLDRQSARAELFGRQQKNHHRLRVVS